MKEVWKDIVGYEGIYQISSIGRVKSLKRGIGASDKDVILKNLTCGGGYQRIILYKNKKGIQYSVHRLVAIMFIDNPENKYAVNHKNGIKKDNRIVNLEWCTRQENVTHAWSRGLCDKVHTSPRPNARFNELSVRLIRLSYNKYHLSLKELAHLYKTTQSHIHKIASKDYYKHIL